MNSPSFHPFTSAARLGAVLALLVFLRASGVEPVVNSRWLLVFDTSVTMKKNLPGTETAVKKFFADAAGGQLQPGDSVAVWLVNRQIGGQCPTFTPGASNAPVLESNLV